VAKRLVDYARVDAHLCHELLIREGLIQGQTKLNLPFLQQNLAMIERVQELEEMSRRRDILVDEEQMLDFYQELIPEHVVSEASLMKWYRKLDSHFKQRLIFDPDSLKKHDADSVNEFNFPKIWQQGNIKLKLQYQFEPNAADDGVSALIPLALLNQVEEVGFDWLVPGFRHDLIVALIRSLPKRLRRNFVPAPNFAQACIADMPTHDKKGQPLGFVESLSEKLFKMTGVKVDSHEWQLESIEEHLKFNFIIIDENQKILKQGRDLHSLKMTLQGKVKQTLRKVAKPGIEKENITEWDFPELQKEYLDQSSGFEVKAFPALVEQSQSVAIRLFDSADAAHWHHKIGLRKLIRLNIPSPIKYLQEKLPNKAKLGLYFNPFGQIKALIDDCIDAAVDDLLAGFCQSNRVDIRDRASFDLAKEYVREHLNDTVLQIATKVEQGLTTAHGIQKRLKGNVPLNLISAHGDIKQHLSSLVFGGFVAQLGAQKLDDWNRYIKAIERRLEKLLIDPNKDRLHQLNIEKIQSQYQDRLNKIPKGKLVPEDLLAVRWMIEELRVSFFAQQLGTPMPISIKRIENVLAAF
jgi:ATP-dependent helicase HrpA